MPNDFYCREILSGKLSVHRILETERVLAYHHTQPYWEVHVVVVPKKHIESISHLSSEEDRQIGTELLEVIAKVSKRIEKEFGGCRVSTNVGDYQDTRHLHFYIHSGKRLRAEDGTSIKDTET